MDELWIEPLKAANLAGGFKCVKTALVNPPGEWQVDSDKEHVLPRKRPERVGRK